MSSSLPALAALPSGLRDPLLKEYQTIIQNFLEGRWTPSELSGGKFCEIVFTILDGHVSGAYASRPGKPRDMVSACRALEQKTGVPRSFQLLIPRLLPALYEVRNNRGVGHAGGEVDPNHMDATVVLGIVNWIMAELVRVLHNLPTTEEAQAIVDSLATRRVPLIWENGNVRRVLDPKLSLRDQVLLLAASTATPASVTELMSWTDYKNKVYFGKLIKGLHDARLIDKSVDGITVLPPGMIEVERLVRQHHDRQGAK